MVNVLISIFTHFLIATLGQTRRGGEVQENIRRPVIFIHLSLTRILFRFRIPALLAIYLSVKDQNSPFTMSYGYVGAPVAFNGTLPNGGDSSTSTIVFLYS